MACKAARNGCCALPARFSGKLRLRIRRLSSCQGSGVTRIRSQGPALVKLDIARPSLIKGRYQVLFCARGLWKPVNCQAISLPPPAEFLQPLMSGARRGPILFLCCCGPDGDELRPAPQQGPSAAHHLSTPSEIMWDAP
jgi:hypothetical protein